MNLLVAADSRESSRITLEGLGRWVDTHVLLLLTIILVVAAAIRVLLFRGWVGLDDGEYTRFAFLLAQGSPFPADYTGPAVFPLRVGVFAPAAAAIRVFGLSEWALALYPFVLSLASIVLAYFCASMYFGPRAGVIAAAILGFYHRDIESATILLPDLPSAFFAAAAITGIVVLEKHAIARRTLLSAGGLLAGFAFGIAWLCKESVAYLAPFALILLAWHVRAHGRRALILWGGVAAGSLTVLITECLVYYAATGDFMFRIHEMERNYRQWENGFFTQGSSFGWEPGVDYRSALIDRLFVSGPRMMLFDGSLYFVPFLGLLAGAYGWWRRDRAFLVPGLWLLTLLFMFNFASSSTSSYVPLSLFYRYLFPIFFPAIVACAGLIAGLLWDRGRTRSATTASFGVSQAAAFTIVAALLWPAAPHLYFNLKAPAGSWDEEVRTFQGKVTADTPLYADALTLRGFEFFNRYPEKTAWVDFHQIGSERDIPAGSLVLINHRYLRWLDKNAGMWISWPAPGLVNKAQHRTHAFYQQPPDSWQTVWGNGNAQLYRVGEQRRIAAAQ